MLEAAWWGFVGGGALLIGVLLGIFLPTPTKVVGLIMAFGAGAVSTSSFELTREAYDGAGGTTVVLGLLAGRTQVGHSALCRSGAAPAQALPHAPAGGRRSRRPALAQQPGASQAPHRAATATAQSSHAP